MERGGKGRGASNREERGGVKKRWDIEKNEMVMFTIRIYTGFYHVGKALEKVHWNTFTPE